MITMTMEEIRAMKDDFITPATAASACRMDTGRLIGYAKEGKLPYPVRISGNRVLISRLGFLKAYGYAEPEEEKKPTVEQLLEKLITEVHGLTLVLFGIMKAVNPEVAMSEKRKGAADL